MSGRRTPHRSVPTDSATEAHFAAWTNEFRQPDAAPAVKKSSQKRTSGRKARGSVSTDANLALEAERRQIEHLVKSVKGNLQLPPRLSSLIFTKIRPDAVSAYCDAVRQGFTELKAIIDAYKVPTTDANNSAETPTSNNSQKLESQAAERKIQQALLEERRQMLADRFPPFEWIIDLQDWIKAYLFTPVPASMHASDRSSLIKALDIVEMLMDKKEPELIKLEEDAKAFAARKVSIAPAGRPAPAARPPRRSHGSAYGRPAIRMTPEQEAASEAALAAKAGLKVGSPNATSTGYTQRGGTLPASGNTKKSKRKGKK